MDYAKPSSRRGSWCGAVVFFIFLIVGLWWLCSKPSESVSRIPVLVEEVTVDVEEHGQEERGVHAQPGLKTTTVSKEKTHPKLKTLYGDMMGSGSGRGCTDPKVAASDLARRHPSIVGGATVPLDVASPLVSSIGGLNMPGSVDAGTALSGAFDMTEPGKEYMAAYNPTGLASVMPAGWRADAANPAKCASTGDGSYAEFSRYSISPEAVARSENMKSVLRLSENTRQGMGRTLGYQSLLRNYVTPVGPQPIGDKSMLWNDSSVRQSYIAAVTGSFPDLGLC
jgi:hypothetical protein